MKRRPVIMPRAQTLALARYEARALAARAHAAPPQCRPLWLRASSVAAQVAENIERGADRRALVLAMQVAPFWRNAAACEGVYIRSGNPLNSRRSIE
jgi:hypothetical protein